MGAEREEHPGAVAAVLGRVVLTALGAASRCVDLAVLSRRADLRQVYLELWRQRWHQSPFRADQSFRTTLAARSAEADARTMTYGYTPVHVARRLLRWAGVGPAAVVYDAGAGRGEVLLAARLLHAEAKGRELVAAHVTAAAAPLARIGAGLRVGDAAEDDLRDVTHVFCAWTVFAPAVRARLERAWLRLAPGTRVLTFHCPTSGVGFERLGTRTVWVPWGREEVFLSRRRDDRTPRLRHPNG